MTGYPGKSEMRRHWLDRVIGELDRAHEICLTLGQPGLACRIAAARADAASLRGRA